MRHFNELLHKHLKQIKMTAYRLAILIDRPEQDMYKLVNGNKRPSNEMIEDLAACKDLKLSRDVLFAWRLLDEYQPEEIAIAYHLSR